MLDSGRIRLFVVTAALMAYGCGNEGSTFDPGAVGDDVVMKIIGVVVAEADQTPLADVTVWVDIGTEEGAEPRATARSNAEGRFSMVFTEPDCSVATEMAYRVFARKKGFRDGELTRDGNGGVPVLRCVAREQTIGFQLTTP
ncbi:MAG: hypothetical protein KJO44_03185 [Gemmatimonadetes bacterium]|nr:hypothetical protein [Gemmatimonadota bacterium]